MKMDWKKMGFNTEAEYNKFLEDKWVDKKSVEIVMDTKKRRSIKLAELGI